jgi:signal recognition particle receptor subunit alpha
LNSACNHNTLSLQYKLDNEFELIFVVAYQNILKLTYIDKFLNEIQLRFRDKYKQVLQNSQFGHNFADFESEFASILRECEEEARQSAQVAQKPRSFYESDKSTKTVASMIETKKGFLSNLVSSTSSSSGLSGNNSSSPNQKASTNANNSAKQQLEKSDENEDGNEDEAYMSNEDNSASSPSQTDVKSMILNGRGPRQMKKFDKSSKP